MTSNSFEKDILDVMKIAFSCFKEFMQLKSNSSKRPKQKKITLQPLLGRQGKSKVSLQQLSGYGRLDGAVVDASLSVREVLGSSPRPVKSNTVSQMVRHRCDVSSELCCPGAKPRI